MDTLALWRDAAIEARDTGIPSRPASPSSDDDMPKKGREAEYDALPSDEHDHKRSNSEPLEPRGLSRKPTSSSWVRWWRRGNAMDIDTGNRNNLSGSASASLPVCTTYSFIMQELIRPVHRLRSSQYEGVRRQLPMRHFKINQRPTSLRVLSQYQPQQQHRNLMPPSRSIVALQSRLAARSTLRH